MAVIMATLVVFGLLTVTATPTVIETVVAEQTVVDDGVVSAVTETPAAALVVSPFMGMIDVATTATDGGENTGMLAFGLASFIILVAAAAVVALSPAELGQAHRARGPNSTDLAQASSPIGIGGQWRERRRLSVNPGFRLMALFLAIGLVAAA